MTILFIILIIIASVILGLIVLVQNPKGGGMAGSLAGISNQFMGVKQTTDVLEKGTWIFAAIIAILSITSTFFIPGGTTIVTNTNASGAPLPANSQPGTPANTVPLQTTPPQQ
jgi:preprotein translocase subunit SecG